MFKVTVHANENTVETTYSAPVLLSDAVKDAGGNVPMFCSGKGNCGKCRVKATGMLSAMGKAEKEHLSDRDIEEGIRLACLTYAKGDAHVYTNANKGRLTVVTGGIMPEFEKDKDISGIGLAVDIGTTTVAAYACDLASGNIIKTFCAPNPQASFGADVISRITASLNGEAEVLKASVHNLIDGFKKELEKEVTKTVITGNTAMLYLYSGLNPSDIATAPFDAKNLFGTNDGETYLCPCVSAYVGADLVSAVLSSEITKHGAAFLVDIGTNGEMAVVYNGKLLCCSTAAGPALEGAQIKYGMPALEGAINKVYITSEGKLGYTTIADKPAKGICGSGLIDAVSCMKKLGIIDETGYLEEDIEIGDSDIFITPKDIRQIQLAKSAIRAGINTLLSEAGCGIDEIECFYIAGGFGSYLDKESCGEIGLIPKEITDRVKVLGNGAGSGAVMALLSTDEREKGESLAKSAQTTELATSPKFMEEYMANMMF